MVAIKHPELKKSSGHARLDLATSLDDLNNCIVSTLHSGVQDILHSLCFEFSYCLEQRFPNYGSRLAGESWTVFWSVAKRWVGFNILSGGVKLLWLNILLFYVLLIYKVRLKSLVNVATFEQLGIRKNARGSSFRRNQYVCSSSIAHWNQLNSDACNSDTSVRIRSSD